MLDSLLFFNPSVSPEEEHGMTHGYSILAIGGETIELCMHARVEVDNISV